MYLWLCCVGCLLAMSCLVLISACIPDECRLKLSRPRFMRKLGKQTAHMKTRLRLRNNFATARLQTRLVCAPCSEHYSILMCARIHVCVCGCVCLCACAYVCLCLYVGFVGCLTHTHARFALVTLWFLLCLCSKRRQQLELRATSLQETLARQQADQQRDISQLKLSMQHAKAEAETYKVSVAASACGHGFMCVCARM